LYDYKLGKSSGYQSSLQLASYAALLRASGVRIGGFRYFCCGDGVDKSVWSDEIRTISGKSRGTSCEEKMDLALENLKAIDSLVGMGKCEANYESKSCKKCGYSVICRRFERFDESDFGSEDDDE
jgi:hypothetical protein